MSAPTRVAVVRPKLSNRDAIVKFLAGLATTALQAWALMVVLGAVTPWHEGFWHCVLILVGVRSVLPGNGWLQWTHPYGGKR